MGWKKMSKYAIKLHLQQKASPKKLIGLDIGTSFTGISISCPYLQKTYLLKTIKCPIENKEYCNKLLSAISKQKYLAGIIIGKPEYRLQSIDNFQSRMMTIISQLGQKLQNLDEQKQDLINIDPSVSSLPYCLIDQSRTTFQARRVIYDIQKLIRYHGHIHSTKQLEDGLAAMKILQRFLIYYNTK